MLLVKSATSDLSTFEDLKVTTCLAVIATSSPVFSRTASNRAFELLITFRLSRGRMDFAEVATLKKRSRLNPAVLAIQAPQCVFGMCVVGRDHHLDRDPLQKCHFAATKGLTAQTLAPDDAQGRSRQVKASQGRSRQARQARQVKAGQGKSRQEGRSRQVEACQGRSRQVKAGQVRSEQA